MPHIEQDFYPLVWGTLECCQLCVLIWVM